MSDFESSDATREYTARPQDFISWTYVDKSELQTTDKFPSESTFVVGQTTVFIDDPAKPIPECLSSGSFVRGDTISRRKEVAAQLCARYDSVIGKLQETNNLLRSIDEGERLDETVNAVMKANKSVGLKTVGSLLVFLSTDLERYYHSFVTTAPAQAVNVEIEKQLGMPLAENYAVQAAASMMPAPSVHEDRIMAISLA